MERKYALTRIAAGDYLLPSNDAQTLWRICTYTDGPSMGLIVDWKKDRQFWGLWRFDGSFNGNLDPEAVEDWNRWEQYEGLCKTRAEAIDAAMET